jgi:ubiquinone/menaquinone biosynthesis C-methylase UbiE
VSDGIVDAVRARFDGRAPTYDGSAMHRDLATTVAGFVDLDGVRTLLDVATGTGLVLRALRDVAPDPLRMIGVDVSPGMLAVARAALPGAVLLEADARRLPVADSSVDLVTCVTGLHLIPDTDRVLAEWARVLRPGGRAVTATFAAFDPTHHHRVVAASAPPPYPVVHDPFRTPEALAATAGSAGFTLGRTTTWTDGHDTLLITELTLAR